MSMATAVLSYRPPSRGFVPQTLINSGIVPTGTEMILPHKSTSQPPATHLPPELLARVFEFCVDGEEWLRLSPSLLARVCKLWKTIVESDPHLWTFIKFYFSCGYYGSRDVKEDVLKVKSVIDLYLIRSGALSISLTFIDCRSYDDAPRDLISLLVDRLQTNSRRWKRILFHLTNDYLPQLCAFTSCDLSSLEHLSIHSDVYGDQIPAPYLNLKSAVNLKSFSYTGPGDSSEDTIVIQWEQLAEISFNFVPHKGVISTLDRRLRCLSQSQNLTTCSLGVGDDFPLGLDANQTVILPRLHTLRVRQLFPWSQAGTVIDVLVLPQLQILEIDAIKFEEYDFEVTHWITHHFSDLLARSGCSLLHLYVYFPNNELLHCLALSNTLKSLHFIPYLESHPAKNVISELDVVKTQTRSRLRACDNDGQKGPLLPALQEITLGASEERCLDAMFAMLHSRAGSRARTAGVTALRRVKVLFFYIPPRMKYDDDGERMAAILSRFERELKPWLFESGGRDSNERCEDIQQSLRVQLTLTHYYV